MSVIQVKDNTQQVLSELDAAIGRALKAIGMQAKEYTKAIYPVDTGQLRNSITYVV